MREGDEFYEGWLKSCDGLRLVPIGTFHDMDRAAGWAGVSVDDYPLLTVTAEAAAAPTDAAQGSSGQVVASAAISPCPAPSSVGRRRETEPREVPSGDVLVVGARRRGAADRMRRRR